MSLKIKFSSGNLKFYSLLLVAFTMSFTSGISTAAIVLAVFVHLFDSVKKNELNKLIPARNSWFFIGYYLLIILTLIYTQNLSQGLKKLELNASFLIMPIFLYRLKSLNYPEYKLLLNTFIFGVLLTSFGLLVIALYRFTVLNDADVLYYHELTSPLNFHAVYYSIYVCFAIIILTFRTCKKPKAITFFFLFFLFIMIILLSSKSIILFSFLFLLVVLIQNVSSIRKRLIGVLGILLIFGFISTTGFFKNRINNITKIESLKILMEDSMTDFNKVNGLTLRLMSIKYAVIETIHSPVFLIFGQSFGDKQDFLNQVYERHNMARMVNGEKVGFYGYNLHNQFIETLICAGLIGLIYFLMMLRYIFVRIRKNSIAYAFFALFMWSFLFESVIMVNKGIIPFVFFSLTFINISQFENRNIRN